jgi:hypothetical protein
MAPSLSRLLGQAPPNIFVYRFEMSQENWKDPVIEAYKRDVDLTLLRKNLRLTPEERILAAMELQKLAEEVRRAGENLSEPTLELTK